MELELTPLEKYTKSKARRKNNFKNFDPFSNNVSINTIHFKIHDSPDIYIANSKRELRRAKKSDFELIYYRNSGLLFYNENGSRKRLGEGGVIAIFPKRQNLGTSFLNSLIIQTTLHQINYLGLHKPYLQPIFQSQPTRFQKIFLQSQLSQL